MTQQLNDGRNDDDDDDDTIIINTLPTFWLPDTLFVAGTKVPATNNNIRNFNTHENPRGGSEYCLFDRNSLWV